MHLGNSNNGTSSKETQMNSGPCEQSSYRKSTDTIFKYVYVISWVAWLIAGVYGIVVYFSIYNKEKHNNDYMQTPIIVLVAFCALVSILLSFSLLYLLRTFTAFMVWFAIAFYVVTLLTVPSTYLLSGGSKDASSVAWFIIFGIPALAILLIAICMRKKIALSIQLIHEATRAICHVKWSLFYPLITVFISFGCACFGAFSIYGLLTSINKHDGLSHRLEWICLGINCFVLLWTLLFTDGLSTMALAGTFGDWYWAQDKSAIGGRRLLHYTKIALKYHVGTLALSALVLTLIEILLNVLEIILRAISYRFLRYCCQSCLNSISRIAQFLNTNIQILCIMKGTSFSDSANILLSYISFDVIVKAYVLNRISSIVLNMWRILLIAIVACATYGIIRMRQFNVDENLIPTYILCAVIISLITSLYVTSILRTAISTIFVCYVQDRQMNNGSSKNPYASTYKIATIYAKAA